MPSSLQRETFQIPSSRYSKQLIIFKQMADEVLEQISLSKWVWSQKFSIFLVLMMTDFNHIFVSQYTILYKSYMIWISFILTIMCNMVWLRFLTQNINQLSLDQGQNMQEVKSWLESLMIILPLKGRFSIVFFQLMLVTSLQIMYEIVIEIHYRINKKRDRYYAIRSQIAERLSSSLCKEIPSQFMNQFKNVMGPDKKKIDQKSHQSQSKTKKSDQQSDNYTTRIHYNNRNVATTPNLQHWESNQIFSSLLQLLNRLKCNKLKEPNNKLPEHFKEKQFTYHPLLFSTKFLYLFALLWAENFIWEGIIIKRWKNRTLHLVIAMSCVAEFAIWSILNIVMEKRAEVYFSGKDFIEVNNFGDITVGMY